MGFTHPTAAEGSVGFTHPTVVGPLWNNALSKPARSIAGYAVHAFTASGIVPAGLALAELAKDSPDPRWVFVLLLITTLIDAVDGPMARAVDIKRSAPSIDGRTIDDILDYLTFAVIPLLLTWRMGWIVDGLGWTVMVGMFASLLGFANVTAKDEARGLFRGFPSYWNLYALYAGWLHHLYGPWPGTLLLWALAVATVAPIWLIYPNLAPPRWKPWVMGGAVVWTLALLALLPSFPVIGGWTLAATAIYPAFYVSASWRVARLE